ncbi:MAG TPA: hypothetical protein VLI06_03100 [Solimonas sp.]|nr:hypothetical protein [Solimonas sp.]
MAKGKSAPRAHSSRGSGRKTAAGKTPPVLLESWRKAMRGDAAALEALLPLALQIDPATTAGAGARRMVVRAFQQHARQLQLQAQTAAEPQASVLREQARRRFYQAVLARHVNLQAASTTDTLFASAAAPETTLQPVASAAAAMSESCAPEAACLLDPPPDAPLELLAANQPPVLLGAGGVGLRWEVPDDHGKPISKYELDISPKPLLATVSYSGSTATVSGLVAGSYSFRLRAINADGPGSDSAPSNTVTIGEKPAGVPGPVTARTSGTLAVVEWTAPATGPAVVEYRVCVYDPAVPGRVVARKSVVGGSQSTAFSGLAKGSYSFGVRAIARGGYGNESLSTALAYAPAPSPFEPPLLPFSTDKLLPFNLGDSQLKPEELAKRMSGALSMATKWRAEYLKSLAVKSVNDAMVYEAQIAQLMQMALSKVHTAEMIVSPVLQKVLDQVKGDIEDISGLASSDTVKGIIGQVGEAAATAVSLEGLILFLMDRSPFNFWIGLFEGMICDIACFDTKLQKTEDFLKEYFGGIAQEILEYIKKLIKRVDQLVDDLSAPLRAAVAEVIAGTKQALGDVMLAFGDPPLLQAVAPGSGELLPNGNPLAPLQDVLGKLDGTLVSVLEGIKQSIRAALDAALGGTGLLIKLVKAFIVYPILGILVISFAGGAIAAGIIAAIVMAAGIELLRMVARWLAGPLLDLVADAYKKVEELVGQFGLVFERVMNTLDGGADELRLVAGNLAELRALLPQAFLTDAASLLGQARRSIMQTGTQLALAAERALGLEHCTAFDLISPDYKPALTPAPQLPGGADPSLLGGPALLRDLNLLDAQRAKLLEGKEMVLTHRLSLFRLLGGTGDPAAASGEVLKALNEFLSGGRLVLRLTEDVLVDQGFPGLYRVLISDIRPVGVFGQAVSKAQYLLPLSLPLTITHLGPARTRVKRDANPSAPPLELARLLRLGGSTVEQGLFVKALENPLQKGILPPPRLVEDVVKAAIDRAVAAAAKLFNFGEWTVPIHRYIHRTKRFNGFNQDGNFHKTTAGKDWDYETLAFHAFRNPLPGTTPLFGVVRKTDPFDHFYTTDQNELNDAANEFDIANKWIACHVQALGTPGSVPLHRYNHVDGVRHYYSINTTDFVKDVNPENDQCGVRAKPGPLLLQPPVGETNTAQIRRALEALPDELGTFLATVTDGLLGAGDVARQVRRIQERVLAADFPEDIVDESSVTHRSEAELRTALEQRKLFDNLRLGYPLSINPLNSNQRKTFAGLGTMLLDAHDRALREQCGRIAKWGGASFTEDRDPHVRALGFVTMEQNLPAESAIFNLLPDATPMLGSLTGSPAGLPGQQPPTALSTLQYRPFENRPLESEFLLSLDTLLPLGTLTDLLFEVTVRACFDENLAAAVKASRSQRAGLLERANAIASGANRVLTLPGSLPKRDFTPTSIRTFNLSLRAHRDNVVQLAQAALGALGTGATNPLPLKLDGLKPLAAGEPLRALRDKDDKPLRSIALQFQREKPTSLGALAQLIALTPEDFGLPGGSQLLAQLDSLLGSDAGELAGMGLAIVPAVDIKKPENAAAYARITAQIDPLLGRLLPTLDQKDQLNAVVSKRLLMTDPGALRQVGWKELWGAAKLALPDGVPLLSAKPAQGDALPPFLKLDLGDALEKGLIHDVIFSFSVRVPARLLGTASAVFH